MINKQDFTIKEIRTPNGVKDYWFDVTGDTAKELLDRIMEQGMQCVSSVVMAKENDEWILGIKAIYPFNFNVIICEFQDVKNVLIDTIDNLDESLIPFSSEQYF